MGHTSETIIQDGRALGLRRIPIVRGRGQTKAGEASSWRHSACRDMELRPEHLLVKPGQVSLHGDLGLFGGGVIWECLLSSTQGFPIRQKSAFKFKKAFQYIISIWLSSYQRS